MANSVTAREITQALGGELIGPPELRITRIGALEGATPSTISFLAHPRFQAQLEHTQAGCVIVAPAFRDLACARGTTIVTADPYLYFARLTQWWVALTRPAAPGAVHPSAVIDPMARIAPGACIAALAVVEASAVIEEGAVIGAHSFVGAGASVGAFTRLAARVTLGAGCRIGARCVVHSGVVIGADGFGFAPVDGRWEKIEQLGAVRIGNEVEIGANTCIDRGTLEDTVIEDGVKLDNLIQIGHNVHIGAHSAIAGNAGVAGSARIGPHCTIGGAANVLGHLSLAQGVHISAASVVTRSIHQPGLYSGIFPIDDNAAWEKNAATLRQLHALRDRLRALEKKSS
ncbi:MAG: UDP-3-O-(3-hydroxymyristoyl)glucosamine N-acyltransferase [Burkholderiaceae bacterium]